MQYHIRLPHRLNCSMNFPFNKIFLFPKMFTYIVIWICSLFIDSLRQYLPLFFFIIKWCITGLYVCNTRYCTFQSIIQTIQRDTEERMCVYFVVVNIMCVLCSVPCILKLYRPCVSISHFPVHWTSFTWLCARHIQAICVEIFSYLDGHVQIAYRYIVVFLFLFEWKLLYCYIQYIQIQTFIYVHLLMMYNSQVQNNNDDAIVGSLKKWKKKWLDISCTT